MKRKVFFQVAKTLFNDECLKACPRCQHPARCQSVKGEGVCSHPDCGFQFCTSCLCAFHGSRECGSQMVGSRKKDTLLPGSAQSKRNVRRLWAHWQRGEAATVGSAATTWDFLPVTVSLWMSFYCIFLQCFCLCIFMMHDVSLWCTVTVLLYMILQ